MTNAAPAQNLAFPRRDGARRRDPDCQTAHQHQRTSGKKGRRSAERRKPSTVRTKLDAEASSAEDARLSTLHRGTRRTGRIQYRLSSRPALPETRLGGRYPLRPVTVYRAPRGPVVVPVGRGPRAARVRGYEPHPREPHLPRQSAVTGDVPYGQGLIGVVTYKGTNVNKNVTTIFLFARWERGCETASGDQPPW
jgi:hypothetical protein